MSKLSAILIMLHCAEDTGYAIASLEKVFYQAARRAGFGENSIFWSFKTLANTSLVNKIACDYGHPHKEDLCRFIKENRIETVLAFDLGCPAKVTAVLRQCGVKTIIAYWGASMSQINRGARLAAKKIEYFMRRHKPDRYIFESEAMRKAATHGRGVPYSATTVIYLGVDKDAFHPNYGNDEYVYRALEIPRSRRIVFYSGHMEERKGVRTIVNAAKHLAECGEIANLHFVLCGNKDREADAYIQMLDSSAASEHVTFAGYRHDIALLMRGACIGVIASTGWDSFTMSSIEMMASGLPMIVSDLQGLSETIEHGSNGYVIPPGDHIKLADRIKEVTSTPVLLEAFSRESRKRALEKFSVDRQIERISYVLGGSLLKAC